MINKKILSVIMSAIVLMLVITVSAGVIITSPENTTYDTPLINLTASDEEFYTWGTWWFNLNDGDNYSFNYNTTLWASEGSNTLQVWNNDINVLTKANVTFTVATNEVPLSINIDNPLNQTYVNAGNISIDITPINLNTYWYSLGTANYSFNVGNMFNFTNGSYQLVVWANDSLNNIASDEVNFFINNSLEYYNYGVYNETNRTMLIKNSFLGMFDNDEIARITLISPINMLAMPGDDSLIAVFHIENYVENYSNVFENLEFFNLKKGGNPMNKNFVYKFKHLEETIVIEQNRTICTDIDDWDTCYEVYDHTEYRDIYEWKNLDNAKLNKLPAGNITIGIFTEVLPGEHGEWIPTLFSERISQWASWQDGFNTDLQCLFRIEEGTGTNLEDIIFPSGNGTLTNFNNPWVTGKIGNYSLQGTRVNNTYVAFTGVDLSGYTSGTMSFWINVNSSGDYEYIASYQTGGYDAGEFFIYKHGVDDKFSWIIETAATQANVYSDDVITGGWKHIILLWGNGGMKMYVNGTLQADTEATTQAITTWPSSPFMAHFSGGIVDFFDGTVDQFAIWNRTLSSAEITTLYNSGTGLLYEAQEPPAVWNQSLSVGLTNYWSFDESAGLTTYDEIDYENYNITFGTIQGWSPGILNNSVRLHDEGFLESANMSLLNKTNGTFNIWVNMSTNTNGIFGSIDGGWNPGEFSLNKLSTEEIRWGTSDGGAGVNQLVSDDKYTPGNWVMITITWNTTSGYLMYVNSTLQSGNTAMNHIALTEYKFGSVESGTDDMQGQMDEHAFWNRSLKQAEIDLLWNNGIGITYVPPPPPVYPKIDITYPENITYNSTAGWWNNSWDNRMLVNITDTLSTEVDRLEYVEVELNGITINTNCTTELRIVDSTDAEIPFDALDGNATYCKAGFITNKTANTDGLYYSYYNNPAAVDPGYTNGFNISGNATNTCVIISEFYNTTITAAATVGDVSFQMIQTIANFGGMVVPYAYHDFEGGTIAVANCNHLDSNLIKNKIQYGDSAGVYVNVTLYEGTKYWKYETSGFTDGGSGIFARSESGAVAQIATYRNDTSGDYKDVTSASNVQVKVAGYIDGGRNDGNSKMFNLCNATSQLQNISGLYVRGAGSAEDPMISIHAAGHLNWGGDMDDLTDHYGGVILDDNTLREEMYMGRTNPLTYALDSEESIGSVIEMNWTFSNSSVSTCWYNFNSTCYELQAGTSVNCIDNYTTGIGSTYGKNYLCLFANNSDGNINSSSVEFTITDVTPSYYATNLPSGTKWVRADNLSIDVSQTSQTGIVEVLTGLNGTNNYTAIVNLNFTANISLTGLTTNASGSKSFIHNSTNISGIINSSLLVPTTGVGEVYICPAADSLTFNVSCTDKITIGINQTKDYMTMTNTSYNGTDYYMITNITGTGGGEGSAPTLTNGNVTPYYGMTADDYYFNVTYTDAENDTTSNVTLTINGTINYTMTEYDALDFNVTDGKVYNVTINLVNGTHNFSFWAVDEANISINTTTYTGPEVNQSSLSVSITYPINSTNYTTNVSALNYTTDADDRCWYNNGTANFTHVAAGDNFTNVVPVLGNNTWTVYCNDSTLSSNSTSIEFNWDIYGPNITFVSPDDYEYLNNGTINFTVNITDDYELKNATLYVYNSTGDLYNSSTYIFVATTTTKTLGIVMTVIDGAYTWFYDAFDWLGNEDVETVAEINLSNDLISYWGFEEGSLSDTNVENSINDSLDLTIYNGYVRTTSGLIGQGLDVSPLGTRYLLSNADFKKSINTTISFWINSTGVGGMSFNPGLFQGFFSNAQNRIYMDKTNTQLKFRDPYTGPPNASLPGVQKWTHYVITYNGNTGLTIVYYNGTQVSNGTGTNLTLEGQLRLIPSSDASDHFHGSVDEIGIWSKVLTADEISALYNNGSGELPYYNYHVTVDTTNPNVTITYPLNKTHYNNVSELNYTLIETNPNRCWYNNGTVNFSDVVAGDNFTNVVPIAGHNTWTVYCNDSSGNENSSSIEFTWDYAPFVVINYPNYTTFVRSDNTSINVADNGQEGIKEIYVAINGSINNYTGSFFMNFSNNVDGGNISMVGAKINTSYSEAKSYIHNTTGVVRILNRSLLIPRVQNSGEVYICPEASNFETVNITCTNKTKLLVGETKDGMTMSEVTIDSKPYYKIINITGTGGGEGSAPTLTNGNVTPYYGNGNFYFNVTYTDAENDTAKYVYVNLNGTINYTMTEYNSSDYNITDGKVYNVTLNLPEGTHNFSFLAADNASVSINTTTYTGPVVDTTIPKIYMTSPANQTYNYTNISLIWNYTEDLPSWSGYSLNGGANVTILFNTSDTAEKIINTSSQEIFFTGLNNLNHTTTFNLPMNTSTVTAAFLNITGRALIEGESIETGTIGGGDDPIDLTTVTTNSFHMLTSSGQVYIFNSSGFVTGSYSVAVQASNPKGIAFSGGGVGGAMGNYIWIYDYQPIGTSRVYKYTTSGSYTGSSINLAYNNKGSNVMTIASTVFFITDNTRVHKYVYPTGNYIGNHSVSNATIYGIFYNPNRGWVGIGENLSNMGVHYYNGSFDYMHSYDPGIVSNTGISYSVRGELFVLRDDNIPPGSNPILYRISDVNGTSINVSMDILEDNNYEWNYTGVFNISEKTNDISTILNNAFDHGNCTGGTIDGNYCLIPVRFSSNHSGVIDYRLNIQFDSALESIIAQEGKNTITLSINDSAGNGNSTTTLFYVDSLIPNATLISPVNDTTSSNLSYNFTANFTDSGGLDNVTLYIYNSSGLYNQTTTVIVGGVAQKLLGTIVTVVEEVYTWFYKVFDIQGNVGYSENFTLNVDTSNPLLTINTPLNQSYAAGNITFNVSGDDDLSSCNFTINDWVKNYTMTNLTITEYNYTNSSMNDGSYTAKFWCDNIVGLINNTESVTFIVDTISPEINYTSPTPSNGTNQSFNSIYVNVTWNETNPDSLLFRLHNSTGEYNLTIRTANYTNWTGLRDDIYYFNVTLNDTSGNNNVTDTRRVLIDTLAPNVSLISPSNGLNNTADINFTALMNDSAGLKNATLYVYNSSGGIYNNTTTTFTSGVTTKILGVKVNTLLDGNYTWFYEVFDWVDHGTNSSIRNLTIDDSDPSINITYPSVQVDYHRNNTNLSFIWVVNETNPDSCAYWYTGGATNNISVPCSQNTSNITITNDGQTNISIWINDTSGTETTFTRNWSYKVYEVNTTFSNWSYEGDFQTFVLNITTDENETIDTAYIVYNGTSHLATVSGTTPDLIVTGDINVPISNGNENRSFTWNVIYGNNESINTTFEYNQTLIPVVLTICNASVTFPYINYTFIDEVNLTLDLNASTNLAQWTYWINNSLYNKTYSYTNIPENESYAFCFSPPNRTMYGEVDYQYSATNYPLRTYYNSSLNEPVNTTRNHTLYLLSSTDGQYVTFSVVDTTETALEGADVLITRVIGGVETVVGFEETDATGAATFWLNYNQAHSIQVSNTGCDDATFTITPSETSYTITLNCLGGSQIAGEGSTEGVRYSRSPRVGGTTASGEITFEYLVISLRYDILKAKFELYHANGSFIASNETAPTSSFCNATRCYLTLTLNTTAGDDIKGRYYLSVNNTDTNSTGYFLLESDAHWRFIDSVVGDIGTMKDMFTNLKSLFYAWRPVGYDPISGWNYTDLSCEQYTDETTCEANSCYWEDYVVEGICYDFNWKNRIEYSRIVFFFLVFAIVLTIFGRISGYDLQNPGAFLLIITAVIGFATFANGITGPGFFYYNNLTPVPFINNSILFISLAFFTAGYYLSINRRYT